MVDKDRAGKERSLNLKKPRFMMLRLIQDGVLRDLMPVVVEKIGNQDNLEKNSQDFGHEKVKL